MVTNYREIILCVHTFTTVAMVQLPNHLLSNSHKKHRGVGGGGWGWVGGGGVGVGGGGGGGGGWGGGGGGVNTYVTWCFDIWFWI